MKSRIGLLYILSVLEGIVITFVEQNFQKGSQKADEYIRIIKDKLEIAVSQCIEAAGHEIDPAKQKPLLRVCTYLTEKKFHVIMPMVI